MKTILYLLRHGATESNLSRPARLQGRRHNPPLSRLGVRQAEVTRDFLALRPVDQCYCSPMLRAVQTAAIVAAPHGLSPFPLEALTECDIGRWEGLDWQAIRYLDAEAYQRFNSNPHENGYPGGESFGDVFNRVSTAIEEILKQHEGQSILTLAHHVVNRTYLAGVLGLSMEQARQMTLDYCGISMVIREDNQTTVQTLNAAFHLQGLSAA